MTKSKGSPLLSLNMVTGPLLSARMMTHHVHYGFILSHLNNTHSPWLKWIPLFNARLIDHLWVQEWRSTLFSFSPGFILISWSRIKFEWAIIKIFIWNFNFLKYFFASQIAPIYTVASYLFWMSMMKIIKRTLNVDKQPKRPFNSIYISK